MNIDLELYRVFCEVVKYKNISKAAENMYLSQSAVTQSIQKLEKLLGGKVFYRNKNGVELTEEGKNLYEYVKNSIETMSNAENIFSKYITLEKGKIRIGGGNALVSSMILNPMFKFIE
ncbi:LysR family transcriptional regulator, partial [Haemophilus sp.]